VNYPRRNPTGLLVVTRISPVTQFSPAALLMSPSHDYNTFYQTTSMKKTSSNLQKDIQHFCFCLGLRSGSIILTVWWLISGLISSIYSFYALTLGHQNEYTRTQSLAIVFGLESASIFVVALFGLRALVTRNTVSAIRVYVRLVWIFMVVLWILLSAAILTVFINSKGEYEDMCAGCINEWKSGLLKLLAVTILTSIFNIYFAMILKVYLTRREARIKHQKRDSVRNPRFSLTSGMSTNFSRSRPSSIASFMKDINTLRPPTVGLKTNYQPFRPPTYMSSIHLNNVILNQEAVEIRHHSMVGDATPSAASSYNNNDDSHKDSMMGDATVITTNPSPYQYQPQQYVWSKEELERNFESLFGTMDITEYKN
jgi:hypothetical protein